FFITSHSNILLDAVEDDDKVYHFAQDANGACFATEASDIVTHHSVLDALGVTGSSLLQTNCVIWVEGPSDRLYIRQWLNEFSGNRKDSLREGIDYSFLFYGGSILSHFQFEPTDEDVQELISLLKISRFSAVIMDKNGRLTESQIRILEQSAKDANHRYVKHTDGREIENDISREVFLTAVAEFLNVNNIDLTTLQMNDSTRYVDQIASFLSSNDSIKQETFRNKLSRKVNLSMKVL